jgi:predicted transcriptional regulator
MEMMDMHHAEYAVVLDGLNYLGLLDIVDLEEADPSSELIVLEQYFIKAQVKTNDHFLQALKVKSKFNLDLIPVLNEKNEWEGIIKADTLLEQTSLLLGASNTGAFIVLEIPRTAYAPGQINRLVAAEYHYRSVHWHVATGHPGEQRGGI